MHKTMPFDWESLAGLDPDSQEALAFADPDDTDSDAQQKELEVFLEKFRDSTLEWEALELLPGEDQAG